LASRRGSASFTRADSPRDYSPSRGTGAPDLSRLPDKNRKAALSKMAGSRPGHPTGWWCLLQRLSGPRSKPRSYSRRMPEHLLYCTNAGARRSLTGMAGNPSASALPMSRGCRKPCHFVNIRPPQNIGLLSSQAIVFVTNSFADRSNNRVARNTGGAGFHGRSGHCYFMQVTCRKARLQAPWQALAPPIYTAGANMTCGLVRSTLR